MTSFREAPSNELESPRELTPDMRADASSAGRFLRLFGAIWLSVGAGLTVVGGALAATLGLPFIGLLAFGAVAAIAGGTVHLIGRLKRRHMLQVFESGVEVRAEVTKVVYETRVRMNRRSPWRVFYRYTAEGAEHEGVATYWTDERPEVEIGAEVTALYVPGHPSESVMWTRIAPTRVRTATTTDRVRVATPASAGNNEPSLSDTAASSDATARDEAAEDELSADERAREATAQRGPT